MKYKDIELISKLLEPIKLDVVKSLSRRRFLKLFKEEKENLHELQEELKQKYAKKKPDGTLLVADRTIQFEPANKKLFIEEMKKLQDVDVKIDFSKNKEDAKTCITIMENEKDKFIKDTKGQMSDNEYMFLESIDDIISLLKEI